MSKPDRELIYLDLRKDKHGSFVGDQHGREVAGMKNFNVSQKSGTVVRSTSSNQAVGITGMPLREISMDWISLEPPVPAVKPVKLEPTENKIALSKAAKLGATVEECDFGKQRVVKIKCDSDKYTPEMLEAFTRQVKQTFGGDTVVMLTRPDIDFEFFELERSEPLPDFAEERKKGADWNF